MLSNIQKLNKYFGLVIGVGTFISIIFIIFYVNRSEILNENKVRINIVINYLDKILSQNEDIYQVSSHLLRKKCNADTINKLNELVLRAPELGSIAFLKNGKVICSSHPDFFTGLNLNDKSWWGNMMIIPERNNNLPMILTRMKFDNYSVVLATSYYQLRDIISVVSITPVVYFLHNKRVFSLNAKEMNNLEQIKEYFYARSNKYPFSLAYNIPFSTQSLYALKNSWFLLPLALLIGFLVGRRYSHYSKSKSPMEMLDRAIINNEIVPYFQPIVSQYEKKIIGCEVLVRWHHPVTGVIPPDEFIPLAESSGLISKMTSKLMLDVAEAFTKIADHLPSCFHISINISPSNFLTNSLEDDCNKFLSLFPEDKIKLVLELTEREQLTISAEAKSFFDKLQHKGILFALDDFGTGYATHSYLQSFSVNYIKIDKGFVQMVGIDDISRHIVENVIELARRLNINIIAEGVETKEQEDFLIENGVSYLQGYRYSPPLQFDDFIKIWIAVR
ncbi:cyclic diguanylate phosphodiesterase [Escherichia coli]|nr:cyclic diguanylate phosphodiesterase [Escherichia coli]HCZ4498269.1 EAL domain-containing protein [Escherichia coli]